MESKGKILVVDDEEGMCEFLELMLRDEGYEVDSTYSADKALQKIKEGGFALILADIRMPGMDGLEMLQQIREFDDEAVVIVMTAYASLETAVKAIRCDAYDYLIKPFDDTDKILAVIEKGMEKHRELVKGKELL